MNEFSDMVRVRDNHCQWYLIPAELQEDFQIMMLGADQHQWGTDEWYEANEGLTDFFGRYLVA